jgi:hypothetical protein
VARRCAALPGGSHHLMALAGAAYDARVAGGEAGEGGLAHRGHGRQGGAMLRALLATLALAPDDERLG